MGAYDDKTEITQSIALPTIRQKTTILFAGNSGAVNPQPFLMEQASKVIQCNIPAGFTSVSVDCEGTNDLANWKSIANFTASGDVVNTDPYKYLRANPTTVSGGGAVGANIPVARKTDTVAITGGTLSPASLEFYLTQGILWEITSIVNTIGEWVLFTDFSTSTEWNGVNMPCVDVGSSTALIFDFNGEKTSEKSLQAGTIDLSAAIISMTVGE